MCVCAQACVRAFNNNIIFGHYFFKYEMNSGFGSVPESGFSSVPDSGLGSVPDSGFSSVPDSGFSSVPDSGLGSVPDSGFSSVLDSGLGSVPDSGFSSVPDSVSAEYWILYAGLKLILICYKKKPTTKFIRKIFMLF